MLRVKPRLKYCGLTIVLSNPSRFDKVALLTANGGNLFNQFLRPEFNTMQCDIRLMEDRSPLEEGTKAIILLGQSAMHGWLPQTKNNYLNELRGSPFYYENIPTICSYFPQDCCDIKAYEQQHNTESKEYTGEESEEGDDEEGDVKTFSQTKRSNYGFWLRQDLRKLKRVMCSTERTWPIESQPVYKVYPPADTVIQTLEGNTDKYLYFDIETDYEEQNLLCFSFSFDGATIYSVPTLNNDYRWAYTALPFIFRALALAIQNNILVAHNGHGFDFFVLGHKYHIPIQRTYDTMIAQHRCFPDIEKSLGHCVSLWTHQQFHKDEDSIAYRTTDQMMSRLRYCGKDVFTMYLVHQAIEKYAQTIPGLQESIAVGQASIRPYLTATLQGLSYDAQKVELLKKENDELMNQYIRIIEMLIGPTGMAECRRAIKGKAGLLPGSNAQCVDYFHRQLEYPIVHRSSTTGKPSLGKKSMYRLALKHHNPVITFINLFRKVQKEYSALDFIPWKENRNSTMYQLAGPKTLRRGSRKILSKCGSNLQNIEKSLRAIYTSDGLT